MPETLIAIVGIEKVIPRFADLEVLLQTLPRSATGERMNPYNSIWSGVVPDDGPKNMHVVLLDNGRTRVLRDAVGRQTLQCIRCGACQNACPVYRQTGGHAYGSVYAGPIGAILTPQLEDMRYAQSLPYASSLCGACYEVCPVKINIPEVLVHLRARVVDRGRRKLTSLFDQERAGMMMMAAVFANRSRYETAQRLARTAQSAVRHGDAWYHWLPGMAGRWTQTRDLAPLAAADLPRMVAAARAVVTPGEISSRDRVLERIRRANSRAAGPQEAIPRGYDGAGPHRASVQGKDEVVALFERRLHDYDARVFRVRT